MRSKMTNAREGERGEKGRDRKRDKTCAKIPAKIFTQGFAMYFWIWFRLRFWPSGGVEVVL